MAASSPPPVIPSVTDDRPRPFWSVMVPAYRAGTYLNAALQSVLVQDPGPSEMEIVVIDDASPETKAEEIIRSVGGGRIGFRRNARNLGLAGNWNECIQQARGHVTHLLHQDDVVAPGFYERLRAGLGNSPEVGAAFCRFGYVDEQGTRTWQAPAEREAAGLLDDWLDRIAAKCRIQCPAIVVRRAVYERLGGFRPELSFALDWEMWVRIAAHYRFWYEPETLADHRTHEGSETSRLIKAGVLLDDMQKAVRWMAVDLPPEQARSVRLAEHECSRLAFRQARQCMQAGEWERARRLIEQATEIDGSSVTRRRALRMKARLNVTRLWRSLRG